MWHLSSPVRVKGQVVKGFGRGSKQLGIPTANMDSEAVATLDLEPGIYFGWARVDNGSVYKMVVSIGWNPFYKNEMKSVETHVLHVFEEDFYHQTLRIVITSYIRPEQNYNSLDELIKAIRNDIDTANSGLDQPQCLALKADEFITQHLELNRDAAPLHQR